MKNVNISMHFFQEMAYTLFYSKISQHFSSMDYSTFGKITSGLQFDKEATTSAQHMDSNFINLWWKRRRHL